MAAAFTFVFFTSRMMAHFAFESRRHGRYARWFWGEVYGSYRNDPFLPVEELISLEFGKQRICFILWLILCSNKLFYVKPPNHSIYFKDFSKVTLFTKPWWPLTFCTLNKAYRLIYRKWICICSGGISAIIVFDMKRQKNKITIKTNWYWPILHHFCTIPLIFKLSKHEKAARHFIFYFSISAHCLYKARDYTLPYLIGQYGIATKSQVRSGEKCPVRKLVSTSWDKTFIRCRHLTDGYWEVKSRLPVMDNRRWPKERTQSQYIIY